MKIFALYTVFNGCELLEGSIKQIEEFVDDIIVCKQDFSNRGHQINPDDLDISMSQPGHVITYTPNKAVDPKENERRKHQLLIDKAKDLGATHFILIAVDHYYHPKQIKKAIELYKKNPVDVTATRMYTYYKFPTWRLTPMEDYVMPFICRLYQNTTFSKLTRYPWITDPSVRITNADTFYLYSESELIMHHYSMVRKDIESKFENQAAGKNWIGKRQQLLDEYYLYDPKENPGITYFSGRKVEVVKDEFGINRMKWIQEVKRKSKEYAKTKADRDAREAA